MCYIEFIVVSLKDRTFRITDDYIMIFLLIIDVLLLSLACVRCETFFREAKLTKRLSLSILAIYKDGLLRGRANRILKILEEHPPIFSVYHMWNLKASTLIQLISILTTIFFNILTLNYLE
nr:uncharacterized protein LOC128669634 [Plodia interpunctella]